MWYKTPRFSQQNLALIQEIYKWCLENLQDGEWGYASGVDTINFAFAKQEDYTLFMMVWYNTVYTERT